jgi:hypothetical protein
MTDADLQDDLPESLSGEEMKLRVGELGPKVVLAHWRDRTWKKEADGRWYLLDG